MTNYQIMFRTIEVSIPKFECNNLRFITVKTPNLKGRGDICVFVPPKEDLSGVPVVILLHGVYGSSWSWANQGGVHFTAMEMITKGEIKPMVIAMPSDGLWGDGSGYLPHDGFNFEKWIVDDVPGVLTEVIPNINTASKLFIGGLSMGGFGALRLGVKHAHKFEAVSAHSAITNLAQMSGFVEEDLRHYHQKEGHEESVLLTIKKYRDNLPVIRFDCGTDDPLIEHNRQLHQNLIEENIRHEYHEFPGGHEWPYWQMHVRKSLSFFDRNL